MATAQDYGFSKTWLKKHPDVNSKVQKAIREGWTQERLAVEIKNTNWYKKNTEAERRWSTIVVEQPDEANKMKADARRAAQQIAGLMGVKLSGSQLNTFAEKGAKFAWDEDDYRVAISGKITMDMITSPTARMGDVANMVAQVNQFEEQYLINVGNKQRLDWARRLARGDVQLEDIRTHFVRHAARTYGGVADDIRAGATVSEILAPYLQDAAEELGVTQASIDLSNPMWTAAITADKNTRALSREEWLTKIRTDGKYGYINTRKAKNEAASISNSVLRMFGSR